MISLQTLFDCSRSRACCTFGLSFMTDHCIVNCDCVAGIFQPFAHPWNPPISGTPSEFSIILPSFIHQFSKQLHLDTHTSSFAHFIGIDAVETHGERLNSTVCVLSGWLERTCLVCENAVAPLFNAG